MADRVVHFLLHVPKCAGTTVEAHFERHLGDAFLVAPRWESIWRNVIGNRYPGLVQEVDLDGLRVVSGHSLSVSLKRLLPGAEIRESVLLRDPVGYHLSLYNYRWSWHRQGHAPEPPAFARWYAVQRRNPISRFLLNRYFEQGVPALYRLSSAGRLAFLEARLAEFWFVGDYRRAAEMISGISKELGIDGRVEDRNVTQEKAVTEGTLGPDWCARILRDNALDAALHARFADRGWYATAALAIEPDGSPGASSPREPAHPAGGEARGAQPGPVLSGADQLRQVWGDIASGLAKKLVR
ncbi:MAG: hypothetical protein AAFR79_09695 [Pseudomonadota bacterium]